MSNVLVERVVPLLIHLISTKGSESALVDLKYGDSDITGSSLAFSRSKGGETSDRPLLPASTKHNFYNCMLIAKL